MKIPISSRLQTVWFLLVGTIVFASLLQWAGIYARFQGFYYDRGWAHFLAYAIAAALCMLAWKQKTATALVMGLFILSIGLPLLHWLVFRVAIDYFGIVVNFFGIIAGVLLGLNVLVFRSRAKDRLAPHNFDSTGR
jgi:hypothetical protein